MRLEDIETKQAELLQKVQSLFENKNRTQKEMDDLYDEIRQFEKEKAGMLHGLLFNENE